MSLSQDERKQFVEAASAMIGMKEKLELEKEKAAEILEGHPGRVPKSSDEVEPYMAIGRRLRDILVEIYRSHPALPAIRFRGHIFSLTVDKGQVLGLSMM